METSHATRSQKQGTLGPLNPIFAMRDAPLHSRCSNPNHPCPVHRPWVGRTPPTTPPGRSTPLRPFSIATTGEGCNTSEPKLTGDKNDYRHEAIEEGQEGWRFTSTLYSVLEIRNRLQCSRMDNFAVYISKLKVPPRQGLEHMFFFLWCSLDFFLCK